MTLPSLVSKIVIISLLLPFTLFRPLYASKTVDDQLSHSKISEICEQTLNYGFCKTTLEQYPRTTLADMKDLATITIMLAMAQARLNKYAVDELQQRKESKHLKDKLASCLDDYTVVLHKLQDAYKICKGKADYKAMMELVNDATSMNIKCQDRFVKHPNRPYPIADYNQKMLWLNNIALVVLSMLA
ncbi:uncharacterized protein LOC124912825 [Impatiens glandulifera]|uniref:uncharacterized protein LOC124912825 n=1 Tax=Impatiens glandulifera TaxID=253017 RepID=UPI001FB16FF0|nr:uncharacterized protein LOC124912825 [Impatiens glandulifera]